MARTVVRFAESAIVDLQGIKNWYADQGVPQIGIRFVCEIFARIETLADHPDIGRVVPEFEQTSLRELIHPPFRIVYRRDAGHARVVRVWRSQSLLRIENDREPE